MSYDAMYDKVRQSVTSKAKNEPITGLEQTDRLGTNGFVPSLLFVHDLLCFALLVTLRRTVSQLKKRGIEGSKRVSMTW